MGLVDMVVFEAGDVLKAHARRMCSAATKRYTPEFFGNPGASA